MSDNTNTEVELSEDGEHVVALSTSTTELFEDYFEVVFTESWKTWNLADQKSFKDSLAAFVMAGNVLREKFDGDVWKGHADGTVSAEVESVRKQREGDTPGKKKAELTPAELLAKRLGKAGK